MTALVILVLWFIAHNGNSPAVCIVAVCIVAVCIVAVCIVAVCIVRVDYSDFDLWVFT